MCIAEFQKANLVPKVCCYSSHKVFQVLGRCKAKSVPELTCERNEGVKILVNSSTKGTLLSCKLEAEQELKQEQEQKQ